MTAIILIGFVGLVCYVGAVGLAQAVVNKKVLKEMQVEIDRYDRVAGGLSPEEREGAKRGLVRQLNTLKAKVKFDRGAMAEAQDKVNYVLYA